MKIGMIGPGAMGTFLAGVLGKKNEVTLLGRRRLGIEKVEIVGETELISKVDFTTDAGEFSKTELVIVCTKAFDTEKAVREVTEHLPSRCNVLSLQNGLKNEEIISDHLGEEKTIGGITSHGVTYLDAGRVKHAGKGETLIGSYPKGKGEDREVKRVAEVFSEAGISTSLSDNITGHIWKKVIVNAGINPVTALLGVKNGFLLEDKNLLKMVEEVVEEATKVAQEYAELPVDDLSKETKKVAKRTQDNKSSMLQDVENQRRTEIDQINGAVVEKGEKKGVPVHANRTLYWLVKGLQSTYLDQ